MKTALKKYSKRSTENMTAKDYLKQYKRINERLRQMQKELEYIEAQVESIGGANDGMPRGSDISDKTGNLATIIAESKRGYEHVMTESLRIRRNIESTINAVEDPLQSRLLYERYVECKPWRVIAGDMIMDEVYVRGRLHGRALESVRKITGME